MSKIEKINKLSELFDLYQSLLTEVQKKAFTYYYLDDLSLSEISKLLQTSRSSVLDNIKKTEEKLIKYEEKLNLSKRNKKIEILLDKIEDKKISLKIQELL